MSTKSLTALTTAVATHIYNYVKLDVPTLNYVAVTSSDDFDTDLLRIRKVGNKEDSVNRELFPSVVLGKSSIAKYTAIKDLGSRTTLHDGSNTIKFRNVKVLYNARVYSESYDECEGLLERLYLDDLINLKFSYTVPGVTLSAPLTANMNIILPDNESRVSTRSMKEQQGHIYTLSFKLEVFGIIIGSTSPAEIIETSIATIYDLDEPTTLLGTVTVIDN